VANLTCGACGIVFGVPDHWEQSRRADGTTFYCPNGHIRAFRKTELGILKQEKEALELRLQAQINEAEHGRLVAIRERDKAIKEKRRVERRIAHGVCPCCNKTFADLSNHMVTEHKEFRLPAGKQPKQITGAIQ
jgi:hypothetical protein